MLLVKLLQSLFKALNSEGTPGQVAAGIALGSVFGLTPLLNLHNLILLILAVVLNVSFAGVMLGWVAFLPLGFLLDPLFHALGLRLLVHTPALTPIWNAWYNTPVLALSHFNNTIVLGSFISWLVLFLPLFFGLRWAVTRYRTTLHERLRRTRLFQAVRASRLYNLYTLLRP